MAWPAPPFHIGLWRRGGLRRRRRPAGPSGPTHRLKEAGPVQLLDAGGQLPVLEELREELQTLTDCLCAAGALTAAELSFRRQQRLAAARMRALLTQPRAAKRLAEALGLEPVGRLSATCSTVSATFEAILFPRGKEPALPEERRHAAYTSLGILRAPAGPAETEDPQQMRPGSTVSKLFPWPFNPSSPTASPATPPVNEPDPPADLSMEQTTNQNATPALTEENTTGSCETATVEPNAEVNALETGAPKSSWPKTANPDRERLETEKLLTTEKPETAKLETQSDPSCTGQQSQVVEDEAVGYGGAASLLCVAKARLDSSADSQPECQTPGFFGRLFLRGDNPQALEKCKQISGISQPVIARPLETLADSNTQVTECPSELELKHLAVKGHGPTAELPCAGVSEDAQPGSPPAQETQGSTVRFLGRILGYGSSTQVADRLENSLTGIHQLAREVGRAAGLIAARQLSQTSKVFAEALAAYVPALRDDAPYVYVCGGSCGIAVDSAERFCPGTGLWESLPPMCVPRKACTAASVGGRFYVLGGVDVPRYSANAYSDSFQQPPAAVENRNRPECFDPVTNTWELLPPINRTYTHAAAASTGGSLYVFGGLSFGSVLDQAHRFDPERHSWEGLEPMPTPRFECAAAAARGVLYVLGGANTCGEPLAVAESYNPSTGHWCSLPCMSEARYGCSAASVDGRVYVFGGHGIWENLSSAETYDPEEDHWSSLPPMSARRNRCGAAVACGKVYVFGGHTNGQDIITIERLDPKTGSWEVAALMARPRNHCMTATVQP